MITRAELIKDMSRFSLFEDVERERLDEIASFCEPLTFPKGTKLFEDADPSDRLFLIKAGIITIHLFCIAPAHNVTITRLYAGDVLGEFALVDNPQRSAAATCQEEAECIAVPVERLLEYLKGRPEVGFLIMRNLAQILAERVKSMNRRLLNLTRSRLF